VDFALHRRSRRPLRSSAARRDEADDAAALQPRIRPPLRNDFIAYGKRLGFRDVRGFRGFGFALALRFLSLLFRKFLLALRKSIVGTGQVWIPYDSRQHIQRRFGSRVARIPPSGKLITDVARGMSPHPVLIGGSSVLGVSKCGRTERDHMKEARWQLQPSSYCSLTVRDQTSQSTWLFDPTQAGERNPIRGTAALRCACRYRSGSGCT